MQVHDQQYKSAAKAMAVASVASVKAGVSSSNIRVRMYIHELTELIQIGHTLIPARPCAHL